MPTVTIPSRFNGPTGRGQGGYSCAALAALLDGPAAVSLRRGVPLDRELEARAEEDGAVRAYADGELIAEAVPAAPLAKWDGPRGGLAAARAAAARFDAPADGIFDRCFVCGRAREDGFDVFAGPLADGDGAGEETPAVDGATVVASPWTPPAWSADEDGVVRPEFVWSALDCPGYFSLHGRELGLAFLARQQTEILTAPRAGETYVVVGVPIERDGRKGRATTALLSEDGTVLAHSELLVIAPRDA